MNGVKGVRLLFTSPLLLTNSEFTHIMKREDESKLKQNKKKIWKKYDQKNKTKKYQKLKTKKNGSTRSIR